MGFLDEDLEVGGVHPLSVEVVSEDPPDRFLIDGNRRWATELTELTIGDVRSDLAKVRSFGRLLEARLGEGAEPFAHLRGREVVLTHDPEAEVKAHRQNDPLLDQLAAALEINRGHTAEAADTGEGSTEPMDARGDYGKIGPFDVLVNERPEFPESIVVTAGIQADIFASEIRDALNSRIAAKDHPPNEVLVISCGLPDPAGYICPLDYTLFHATEEFGENGEIPLSAPKHLKGIALHCLRQRTFGELYRAEGELLPWTI